MISQPLIFEKLHQISSKTLYQLLENDLPIEILITFNRSAISIYLPTNGARKIAEAPRIKAYIDIGKSVFAKIPARYKAAPNSKTREFHIDKKCEIYNRFLICGQTLSSEASPSPSCFAAISACDWRVGEGGAGGFESKGVSSVGNDMVGS